MNFTERFKEALLGALGKRGRKGRERKREAIEEATRHRFPAGPIEQTLQEIERGYGASWNRSSRDR